MDLNTHDNRLKLITDFPHLNDDPEFKITSPETTEYNCIAWAMGFDCRWVQCTNDTYLNTQGMRYVWWPNGVDQSYCPQALIDAFIALGFEQTDNTLFESGYDKAVLYTDGTKWTHASRIIADGTEHSKFGASWDATHGRNRFLDSPYGYPYAYMRRPHSHKQQFINMHPITLGTITINEQNLQNALSTLRKHLSTHSY